MIYNTPFQVGEWISILLSLLLQRRRVPAWVWHKLAINLSIESILASILVETM